MNNFDGRMSVEDMDMRQVVHDYVPSGLPDIVLKKLEGECWDNISLTKTGVIVHLPNGDFYEIPVEVWKKIPLDGFVSLNSKQLPLLVSTLGNFKYSGYIDNSGCWVESYDGDEDDYPEIQKTKKGLFLNYHGKSYSVARIVASTFRGEPVDNLGVTFLDGDPFNCCAYNVDWIYECDEVERQTSIIRVYNEKTGELEHQFLNAIFACCFVNEIANCNIQPKDIGDVCSAGCKAKYGFAFRVACEDELYNLSNEERLAIICGKPKPKVKAKSQDEVAATYRWIRQYLANGTILAGFETLEQIAEALKVPVDWVMEYCKRGAGTLQGYAFRWSDDDELINLSIAEREKVLNKTQGLLDVNAKATEVLPNAVPHDFKDGVVVPANTVEVYAIRKYSSNGKYLLASYKTSRRAAKAVGGEQKDVIDAYQKKQPYMGFLWRSSSRDELYDTAKVIVSKAFRVKDSVSDVMASDKAVVSDESIEEEVQKSQTSMNKVSTDEPSQKLYKRLDAVRTYTTKNKFVASYASLIEASDRTGVSVSDIRRCCRDPKFYVSFKGLKFRFAESDELEKLRGNAEALRDFIKAKVS